MKQYWVYILECSDGSYYIGMCNNLERRFTEHAQGLNPTSYTYKRRPLKLVYFESSRYVNNVLNREKQLKKWSRAKKKAIIEKNWERLVELSKNYTQYGSHGSTGSP